MTEYIYAETHYGYTDGTSLGTKQEKREEIVRCRDCAGFTETWDGWECERFSGEYHRAEPDGFCAWGKRKEGGE